MAKDRTDPNGKKVNFKHKNASGIIKTEERKFEKYEFKNASFNTGKENRNYNGVIQDKYILTGRNPIREALKNHRDLEKLLVQKGELSGSAKEIVQKAKEQKVHIQVVEKSRLDDISPHHQGLIAFASAYQYSSVEEILQTAKERGEEPFIILLDGITDPHNLGAIIRTAECAGVHGIIVPQHHSVGLSPAAVKASAGAVEYLKVARVTNIGRTIDLLKQKNVWVYAVTMNGMDYLKTEFSGGVALVIGSEEDGISRLVREKCDYAVSLPMAGKIESLNASVAAGVIIYQVFSRRK
jgi:23S rRNA (guanosine2251-2'-O)-methyltransferase